jgi:hypothetical protein
VPPTRQSAGREEHPGFARPVGMSEHEHDDAERQDDDEVEAHAAPVTDDVDGEDDDVDTHLFQRR